MSFKFIMVIKLTELFKIVNFLGTYFVKRLGHRNAKKLFILFIKKVCIMHYKRLLGHYNYNVNMYTFCSINITEGLNNCPIKFDENPSKYLLNNLKNIEKNFQ